MPTDAAGGDVPILVGIVARAHGIRGEVVVDPATDAPRRFAPGAVLSAMPPTGHARPLRIASSRPFRERWLIRFEGVETRDAAEALQGAELSVRRDQVAPLPEGRYYRFELLGLEARTTGGDRLGRVEDVFSTGANDVLSVRGARGEVLIPMLDTVIRSVDLAAGVIVLDPPAGLPGLEEPEDEPPRRSPR